MEADRTKNARLIKQFVPNRKYKGQLWDCYIKAIWICSNCGEEYNRQEITYIKSCRKCGLEY